MTVDQLIMALLEIAYKHYDKEVVFVDLDHERRVIGLRDFNTIEATDTRVELYHDRA